MVIKNAWVFTEDKTFVKLDVAFDQRIQVIGCLTGQADINAKGCYLIPGFIDLHTHGAVGQDFSDGNSEGMRLMSEYYASHGITSFCATTMTLREEAITKAMKCIRDYQRTDKSARCAGIYQEGPFLSYAKRGAQAAENLHTPDIGMFHRFQEAAGNRVKLVGVAPELTGAMDFIKEASKTCAVSLAHTTADYATAMEAYACGATQATHLFNGMSPLHHREPSIIGAAFDSGAYAEVICDGIHVHPSVIRMAFRLFGDRLILVSDSLRCAGMPDGSYILGGQAFTMTNGKATLPDGTLAGSSIHLLQAVQNAIAFGISPENAVTAATITPAKAIGADSELGSLSVG
ncbi:MAG: N-acetylglucosamine-6-phosphate deacetylase, partial [Bacillota bacterium]